MKRRENIAFYVLFSIVIGAAAGLALGIAFSKLEIFTILGAIGGMLFGLFTANDKRVTTAGKTTTPKKKTTKKAKKTTKK